MLGMFLGIYCNAVALTISAAMIVLAFSVKFAEEGRFEIIQILILLACLVSHQAGFLVSSYVVADMDD